MKRLIQSFFATLFLLVLSAALLAQQPTQADPSLLTLDTAFSYHAKSLDAVECRRRQRLSGARTGRQCKRALDIVRYDATSGARTIVLAAARLIPKKRASRSGNRALRFSAADSEEVLLFTILPGVWRSNTRVITGIRSEERQVTETWRRRQAFNLDVREVLARRKARRYVGKQPLR